MIFQKCKCVWCVIEPPPYLYRVFGNVYWILIPKNASTAVKVTYPNMELVPHDKYPSTKPIAIIRHPIDRFLSLMNHYFAPGLRYEQGLNFYARLGLKFNEYTLEEKIDILLANTDQLHWEQQVHHWYPQAYWMQSFEEIELVPFKDAKRYFNLKTEHNVSTPTFTAENLTLAHIQQIQEIYEEDYEFLESN